MSGEAGGAGIAPAEVQRILHAGVPLAGSWGVEVLSARDGRALLRLPHHADLLRPGGTISGPALMALADVAMWAALLSLTEGRDESLTASMNVQFLRPCGPGPIVAEARLIKPGGRSLFGEVLIRRAGADEVCVHVTTSWVRPSPR